MSWMLTLQPANRKGEKGERFSVADATLLHPNPHHHLHLTRCISLDFTPRSGATVACKIHDVGEHGLDVRREIWCTPLFLSFLSDRRPISKAREARDSGAAIVFDRLKF